MRGKAGQRRCVVLSEREDITAFFAAENGLERLGFLSFKHMGALPALREDVAVARIDAALNGKIAGRIIPAFSWRDSADFLQIGWDYAVTVGGEPAAWSFSSAIGAGIVDVGVETREAFRGRATAAAAAVAQKIGFTLRKKLSFFRAAQ